ncbi:probable pyridoxine 4-dehydrogenase [Cephalotrichum gorgonifer]|uniref:Probable pyridoxine 4-dehydrogenase n=1 Tax=Cephalotrichum gorgonifer TaxID=2041049 RepID=A0AAE8MWP3_9PEZI|nr:probable pyridoxine 4-dehydrogenase [Cephalotrichum gorgonifer]
MVQLAGKEIGPIGFGLMGLTWRQTPCPEEQAFEAMRAAIAAGSTFWNGGEFYGTPTYNSMTLLERYFSRYPEDATKVVLSMKGALGEHLVPDSSPEGLRRSVDNITGQLKGRKAVDLFECARRDPNRPLEETLGILKKEYIDTGKIGGISLSEVSAATIHEAVKVTKVAAVEVELSLWSTDPLENGVAAACAQYNIPLVAYSPLGRGMLTGQLKSFEDIPEGDFRRLLPRFQPENFQINLELVGQLQNLAAKKGCTPSQLAIGWVLALARRPGMPVIIPIPGATTAARAKENSVVVELTDAEMAEIDAVLAKFKVVGGRYAEGMAING